MLLIIFWTHNANRSQKCLPLQALSMECRTKLKDKGEENVLCNFLLRTYTLSSPLMSSFWKRKWWIFFIGLVGGVFIMTVCEICSMKHSVVCNPRHVIWSWRVEDKLFSKSKPHFFPLHSKRIVQNVIWVSKEHLTPHWLSLSCCVFSLVLDVELNRNFLIVVASQNISSLYLQMFV